jgi:hypothetical protein
MVGSCLFKNCLIDSRSAKEVNLLRGAGDGMNGQNPPYFLNHDMGMSVPQS